MMNDANGRNANNAILFGQSISICLQFVMNILFSIFSPTVENVSFPLKLLSPKTKYFIKWLQTYTAAC